MVLLEALSPYHSRPHHHHHHQNILSIFIIGRGVASEIVLLSLSFSLIFCFLFFANFFCRIFFGVEKRSKVWHTLACQLRTSGRLWCGQKRIQIFFRLVKSNFASIFDSKQISKNFHINHGWNWTRDWSWSDHRWEFASKLGKFSSSSSSFLTFSYLVWWTIVGSNRRSRWS